MLDNRTIRGRLPLLDSKRDPRGLTLNSGEGNLVGGTLANKANSDMANHLATAEALGKIKGITSEKALEEMLFGGGASSLEDRTMFEMERFRKKAALMAKREGMSISSASDKLMGIKPRYALSMLPPANERAASIPTTSPVDVDAIREQAEKGVADAKLKFNAERLAALKHQAATSTPLGSIPQRDWVNTLLEHSASRGAEAPVLTTPGRFIPNTAEEVTARIKELAARRTAQRTEAPAVAPAVAPTVAPAAPEEALKETQAAALDASKKPGRLSRVGKFSKRALGVGGALAAAYGVGRFTSPLAATADTSW